MFIEPNVTLTFMHPSFIRSVRDGNGGFFNVASPALLYPQVHHEYLEDEDDDSDEEDDNDDSNSVDSSDSTTSSDELEENVYPPHYPLQHALYSYSFAHPNTNTVASLSAPATSPSLPPAPIAGNDADSTTDVVKKKPKRKRAPRRNRKRRPLTPEARERRNRRRRVNYFPRLLKSDIRRNYAQMFTNVMNAYDGTLLRHFMMDYCVPTVQLLDFAPENIPYGLPPLVHQIGMKNILKYWASNSVIIPDFVCQTQSVKLCVDPNTNRSRLVCKTLFQGTKVLDIALGEVDRQISRVLQEAKASIVLGTLDPPPMEVEVMLSENPPPPGFMTGTDTVYDSTDTKYNSLVPIHDMDKSKELLDLLRQRKCYESSLFRSRHVPKPLNPPVSILYEGSMILYLDEHFRIYRLDFLGSQVNSL